ncbi:MAG TPA: ATP synthase F1 subunit delta [Aquificae bacterium]|nr:ATP synthase F1 subunit delta [Aquificota bacterium]
MSIINTYVKALYLAIEKTEAEKILKDIELFKSIFTKELKQFLTSPIIPLEKKYKLIDELANKLKFSKKFANFIKLLIKYKKIGLYPKMYPYLRDAILERQGKVEVSITLARKISKNILEEIKNKIEEILGKELITHVNIDPSIIGGACIKIKNTIYDATVKGYLIDLQKSILEG